MTKRKGWFGESYRHEMAAKGIRTNATQSSFIQKQMNNIFNDVDWLEDALEVAVYKEVIYQNDYAKSEMKNSPNQFKYLNDFEFMKWEILNRFFADFDKGIEDYIPDGFEYTPGPNEYVGKDSWAYTYLSENPIFMNKMKKLYDEQLKVID